MVPITAKTSLTQEQECKLVFVINENISKAKELKKTLLQMVLNDQFFKIDCFNAPEASRKTTVELTYIALNSNAKTQMSKFIQDLLDDEDVEIIHVTNVNSIETWTWCKTARAVRKLSRIIKSGYYKNLLALLFPLLLGGTEDNEIEVNLKENSGELQWAIDYITNQPGKLRNKLDITISR